jgi:S1-C subfamily serine protease
MNGRHLFTFGASLLAGLLSLGLAHGPVMGQGQAEALSSSFRKATERVSLAVVSVRPIGPASLLPPGPLRPLDGLSRLPLRVGPGDQEPIGSGVVLDVGRGHVLTTDHVLQGVSQAVVVTADGRERVTSQIRREPGVDLAVLVVDLSGLNLAAATWGDPGTLQPGDWVLAVGRPGGAAPAISSGIFSARRRWSSAAGPGEDWLETDAAVNALNSGGPLINLAGQVVGINTPLTTRRGPIAGVGFALPADNSAGSAARFWGFKSSRLRRRYHPNRAQLTSPR